MALSRPRKISRSPSRKKSIRLFEKLMAAIVLVNFVLVVFDLSYIRFRDFYLRYFPELTQRYGSLYKGIAPERFTVDYLQTVEELEEQVTQTGLQSRQAQALLTELRDKSDAMIDENPFQVADKSGTLERIKNLMRDRIGTESSKEAFQSFWSQDYLGQQAAEDDSLEFFNEEIRPLMETNYFRPIGEDGSPLDEFWKLDRWFVIIFVVELLLRTLYISRKYSGTNWLDAVLWRWYDVLLLLPFWRWLRVVPTIARINQSSLLNLEPIRNRINRIFLSHLAVELTEVVILRVIDQVQNILREGQLTRWVVDAASNQRYVDLNGVDEIQTISQRLTTVLLYQVLPKVKPDIDDIVQHSLTGAFASSSAYQGFQRLPGIGNLPDQVSHRVAAEVTKNLYGALINALEDERGAELTQKLVTSFVETFQSEVQREDTLEEIQTLAIDLLDEVKVNYVQQLAEEDVEELQQRTQRLYEVTQRRQE
ncbi:MAG: hypothetical protein AAF728_07950 [Cyanobacteria bacterium P01_D01_bin.128]